MYKKVNSGDKTRLNWPIMEANHIGYKILLSQIIYKKMYVVNSADG